MSDPSNDADSEEEFMRLIKELQDRCRKANIKIAESSGWIHGKEYNVGIQQGHATRDINIYDAESAKRFLATCFEKYRFISGFSAVFSRDEDVVECGLTTLAPQVGKLGILARVFGKKLPHADDDPLDPIVLQDPKSARQVTIGYIGTVLETFTEGSATETFSITIKGFGVDTHDKALAVLSKVSNSVLFQLDLSAGVAFGLTRYGPSRRKRLNSSASARAVRAMVFPRNEYDHAPISLYMYGRSAQGMPLLQFLAFYQVVEHYYPTYSDKEARIRIKNIIKHPDFRYDRDADIGRILSSIKVRAGAGLSSERNQLKAAIKECVDPQELKEFITSEPSREEFFSAGASRRAFRTFIDVKNAKGDIIFDVANRMYDIRCEIVHTKEENEDSVPKGRLLPFTPEADQLRHDIDLMQFVAKQVLIVSSSSFSA